jgi:hypothetical protein
MSKNRNINILLIILALIFFIIFFYILITNNNKLVKFRVIKDYIENSNDKVDINYNDIKNKYLIKTCKDMCKNKFCDEYQSQLIKYDLCKECKKENKCYDHLEGICVPCKNNYTCEQLYGCSGNSPPINPIDNYCTSCWIK